jgi:hypothetical protein
MIKGCRILKNAKVTTDAKIIIIAKSVMNEECGI